MFRREFKDNLKNKIMRNKQNASDMFNLIKIIINLNNKLYKQVIKK